MATTKADSLEQFEKILEESHRKGCLTVVHFTAPWASQCKQMQEVTDELAKDPAYKNVKFVEVEAENLAELSKRYSVTAVPTFILLKNKSCVDRVNGANAPELNKKVQQHCQQIPVNTEVPITAPKENLDSRIKKLINAAPCMLFMKGNPQEPRCGFSRQTVEILKKHDAEFSSFDILGDEEIRQGLKKYSNWPTYPQLYIKGELIGGLDIIKEMDSGGELASLIPKKQSLDERLKGLINQAPLMVFMKGSGTAPKCGFSRTLIEILTETGLKYETFDILQNEEVRQGLKTFSNWPTYPQVYVNGELVGGLDIIKELKETGELLATLNPSQ